MADDGPAPSPAGRADRRLRVGVLLDGFHLDAWMARILTEIAASDIAEIVLVVKNEAEGQASFSALRKIRERPDLLVYFLYSAADTYLFAPRAGGGRARLRPRGEPALQDPFAPVDVSGLLGRADCLNVRPEQKRFSDYFPEADVKEIKTYDLDVALRFGFRILRGGALDIARYGVWSYHHDDNSRVRGGPAGFWEVLEGDPVTGSILQVLTEDVDAGVVLATGHAATDKYSVMRNRANYFFTSSAFVGRALKRVHDLAADGASGFDVEKRPFKPYNYPFYVRPGNARMARLLARHAAGLAEDAVQRAVTPARWTIGYQLRSGIPALYRSRLLTPPKDTMWADPFPVARNGRSFVFFEEQAAGDLGHIVVVEVDGTGGHSAPVTVLTRPYHLSYPGIYEWNGELYMVPESGETGRVELFRCMEFPHRWELESVLFDGVVTADATLAEVDGTWWMFVVIAQDGTRDYSELHLYSANRPTGPWKAHRRNPVKSDIRSSRPAGRLFTWNGQLHRPAQDCGGRYGRAVSIQQIQRLDEHSFEEIEVGRIEPHWDPSIVATHTFNMVPGLTVIDALVKYPRFRQRPPP